MYSKKSQALVRSAGFIVRKITGRLRNGLVRREVKHQEGEVMKEGLTLKFIEWGGSLEGARKANVLNAKNGGTPSQKETWA